MKTLSIVMLTLFVPIGVYSSNVSSTVSGVIKYLPGKGQIIKKGEIPTKFDTISIKNKIKKAKLELECAKEDFNDKCTDFARMKKLTKVLSRATQEDVKVAYHSSRVNMEKCKIELSDLEASKLDHVIVAPYDLIVKKQVVIPNSGVELGDAILEVENKYIITKL